MSDPAAPHLVSVNRRPPFDPAIIVDPYLDRHPPNGLLGLASTNKHSIASWTRPHTAQAITTAAYDLDRSTRPASLTLSPPTHTH